MNRHLERLRALRQSMQQQGVDACLIVSADPHSSEYLPKHWQIRRWLTGFTGSVGTVVVTATDARVWVDSRYWLAAERELDGTGFVLERIQSGSQQPHISWLREVLPQHAHLAIDGRTLSLSAYEALRNGFDETVTISLDLDLPGQIWLDRPPLPVAPVVELDDSVACHGRADKLALVRAQMRTHGASHHLISTLDDIAWLLNLRGSDVEFNPVFLAHVLIHPQGVCLFVDGNKLDPDLQARLRDDAVEVCDYFEVTAVLEALGEQEVILLDPVRTVCALALGLTATSVFAINPTTLLKSRKTTAQMGNWREVMRHDGAALCEFFAWLEQAIAERAQKPLDEVMVDEVLSACRASQPGFVSRSFATIAAFGANAAMPHYAATPQSNARIEGHGLLLIDSGGQYEGGTTDITRMVPVGALSQAQREDCTAVLKGMIALSRLRMPQGIEAPLIDAVARAPLWERLIDYGHGTGHGVGYFLNVHEGPQVLSYRAPVRPEMGMQAGMVTSNEPGLYRPGQWGVRIENLLHCRAAGESDFGHFLEFETLTLCPIDTRCFIPELLRTDEIQWLNGYHDQVRKALEPLVSGDVLAWLLERTRPLPV